MTALHHLRVEHLDEALGLGLSRPRVSWQLPEGAHRQVAYQLRTEGWDSGRVESDVHVLVAWPGPPASSCQRVSFEVRAWTDLGQSDWSEACAWETGLLHGADWQAQWVEPCEQDGPPPAGSRPAYLLRRDFTAPGRVVRARLYATAHGVYEAFVNGSRVGDLELTPGFTAYRDNLHVQTYDVTGLLVEGDNALGVLLSDGWFRGRAGAMRLADSFGERTGLLCQLHVLHDDGRTTVVGTDQTWRSWTGEVTSADLMDGQVIDLTRTLPGWSEPGFADDHWHKAVVAAGELYEDLTRLTASPAPPVRRIEEIRPVSVRRVGPGRDVVDLGQNINGWVRLRVPSGESLTLTHGEALDPSGDVTTEHLRAEDWFGTGLLPAGQVDRVISAGDVGEVFEPRHTTHGFQYVRVEGASKALTADDVTGIVVHTDFRRTGTFRCSDERLNRLHDIATWSFRGNACDIPTDCPTRERAGWTGDWMLFIPTAAFLYDVAGFSVKWLRDLSADQWDNGCVANFAPDPGGRGVQDLPEEVLDQFAGSSAWGDASVIVPWELYRSYGDVDALAEFRPMMKRWVEFAAERARTRRHPERVARRPEPEPHEQFLWDAGFHWGEWCEPGSRDTDFRTADQGAVGTAYLHLSARLLSRISELTGDEADAVRYAQLAAAALDAWQREFISDDGRLTPDTQATHVRALAFDLVPESLRPATAARLVALIREAGTHVGTGFLATPHLLPVLVEAAQTDLAYELLLQDTEPAWLTMLLRGATTIWEDWDGIDADGVPHASLNHYSKGAVVSFLHTHVAGIRPPSEPDSSSAGYRRFLIQPVPGGGLTWAEGALQSPYGRIESTWRIDEGAFTLTVTVPPGSSAEVRLPDGRVLDAGPGTHTYR